jgi:hypothetical protein
LAFHSAREADHSPPSSVEVKEGVELYLHSPNTPPWHGAQLGGAYGQLLLRFTLIYYKPALQKIYPEQSLRITGAGENGIRELPHFGGKNVTKAEKAMELKQQA